MTVTAFLNLRMVSETLTHQERQRPAPGTLRLTALQTWCQTPRLLGCLWGNTGPQSPDSSAGWGQRSARCGPGQAAGDRPTPHLVGQQLAQRSPSRPRAGESAWMLSCVSRVQLCNPVDCSPPGSSVRGILQARRLEWVAVSFSRGIFQTQGSNPHLMSPALAGRFFTTLATREA